MMENQSKTVPDIEVLESAMARSLRGSRSTTIVCSPLVRRGEEEYLVANIAVSQSIIDKFTVDGKLVIVFEELIAMAEHCELQRLELGKEIRKLGESETGNDPAMVLKLKVEVRELDRIHEQLKHLGISLAAICDALG